MKRALDLRDGLRPQRFDLLLVGTALVMALVTIVLVIDPSLKVVLVDRTLDVALTSISTLAAASLALLTMPRYRESGRTSLLLLATAFVTLAMFSGVSVVLILFRFDYRLGVTLLNPEQLPLYVSSVTRLVTGALFLAAAVAAVRRRRSRLARVRWRLALPVIVITALTALAYPARDVLPPLIDIPGMEALIRDPESVSRLTGTTNLSLAFVAATVVVLGGAAVLFRFTHTGKGTVSDGFLAIGLVMTAFAELHNAFYPSVYIGLVTASDFFRLLAYGVLLLGIVAEQRADLRALRSAYAALDRLRVTESERAALEERARLAREIHDGLAQHLWFAKLKFERLASTVPEDERALASEVGQALDSAIVEARQALLTMRTSLDADLPVSEMLARTIEDFGQRSGLRVTFDAATGLPSAIPPRQQIELLRVVQEALTNVRKHADATVVRVRMESTGRDLLVTVTDNGRGFDPGDAEGKGLGLQGMEERARLMGGQLHVISETQGGTTVELSVPLLVNEWLPGVGEGTGAVSTALGGPLPPVVVQDPMAITSRPIP